MNKLFMFLVVLVTTLFAGQALAFTPPPAPANGRHIVDQAGKLTPNQFSALERKIEGMNSKTQNEFGVLILSNMEGDNIEDAANATYKAWGVGKRGLDNGVLLVISVAERKSRLETGKGVGGDLPDLRCNQILKNNLAPHLKKGDFYSGIDSTLSEVSASLESRAGQKADPKPTSGPSCDISAAGVASGFGWLVVGSLALIVTILVARAHSRRRREEEERNQRELDAARRRRDAEDRARFERDEKRRLENLQKLKTPLVNVPEVVRKPSSFPPPAQAPRQTLKPASVVVGSSAVAAAGAVAAAEEAARRARRAKEEKEAEERRARQRREDEDRARRSREEESRRSSYSSSSSSSYDSGSSWSGGGSDSGSGFGGGDSGGGGSSGDW